MPNSKNPTELENLKRVDIPQTKTAYKLRFLSEGVLLSMQGVTLQVQVLLLF